MRYEVSLYCEELILKAATPRILAFHATLILDAADRAAAEATARSALAGDAQLGALAAEVPAVEIDEVTEISPTATPHGPILCFFQLPQEGGGSSRRRSLTLCATGVSPVQ